MHNKLPRNDNTIICMIGGLSQLCDITTAGEDGVSFISPKFNLLGITLLTEVNELDLRVHAMN